MGGIAAGLQLINYKIDEMSFDHNKNTAFILCNKLDYQKVGTSVSLRVPQKIPGKDEYISGLTMHVEYGENKEDLFFKISIGIVGYFLLKKDDVGIKDTELLSKFLKTQPAAILAPYARAALSSFIISAGLPPIVFPLLNLKKMAEEVLADKNIIELPSSSS